MFPLKVLVFEHYSWTQCTNQREISTIKNLPTKGSEKKKTKKIIYKGRDCYSIPSLHGICYFFYGTLHQQGDFNLTFFQLVSCDKILNMKLLCYKVPNRKLNVNQLVVISL